MKHTAFHSLAEEARKTVRKAAEQLGVDVVFLTLSTGDPAEIASLIGQRAGCGEKLMVLMADGPKSWLFLMSSRPSSITRYSEECHRYDR